MVKICTISIHALLAESDGGKGERLPKNWDFYPRSPCGERLITLGSSNSESSISIHALLAESDGRVSGFRGWAPQYFYPRSPCGERLAVVLDDGAYMPISIHALLAESDLAYRLGFFTGNKFLSTLSLRRATTSIRCSLNHYLAFLSTLSLRRATHASM